jgi:hypothetical protein
MARHDPLSTKMRCSRSGRQWIYGGRHGLSLTGSWLKSNQQASVDVKDNRVLMPSTPRWWWQWSGWCLTRRNPQQQWCLPWRAKSERCRWSLEPVRRCSVARPGMREVDRAMTGCCGVAVSVSILLYSTKEQSPFKNRVLDLAIVCLQDATNYLLDAINCISYVFM